MDGFLLINKPTGWTSRDVCNRVSKLLNVQKVGHSGTLDPFATGLLLLAVNKATKAFLYTNFSYKTYIAKLSLGQKTKTGDLTSEVILNKEVPFLHTSEIENVLKSFVGHSKQKPPMTSAVHVKGMKLYKYAQQGLEIERPEREIDIKYMQLIDYSNDIITFKCQVSSGTYIRVLGEDIATKLGTVGHLIALERVAYKEDESITINEAISLENVSENDLRPILDYIDLPHQEIDEETYRKVLSGQKLKWAKQEEKILLVYNKKALAIYTKEDYEFYRCERGLW